MSIEKALKKQREKLGLSQSHLAQLAGLSLASIQNMEAGKANLSISNLASLLEVLGYDLKLVRKQMDWEALIGYGLPVLSNSSKEQDWVPRVELLEKLLVSACADFLDQEYLHQHKHLREREALLALIIAIRDHFPSFYKNRLKAYKVIREFSLLEMSPKVLKLRRLAIERLVEYL